MKNVKQFVKKMIIRGAGEESLAVIFKPLNGIEEKVTIRKQIIEENILKLKDAKSKIDDQIEAYNSEVGQCDMYLDNVNKFT
jgi:hypothetical protein